MIILDTNIISELMRAAPDPAVKEWIGHQKPVHLGLSTITLAEIQRGLVRLLSGKRRSRLEENFAQFLAKAFNGRIFSFDEDAAHLYGELTAKREKAGFHIDAVDLMIVAIAKSNNACIATRNVNDFKGCGVEIINPWR